jgi:hypothetical protein
VRLITAHRILIAAGIAFFVFYALLQLRRFTASADALALVQAIVSAAIAVGLALYYRGLKHWGQR